MRYPTAGLAKTYKIGRNDMIKPITSGETPSSLPNTRICGKIGPIAREKKLKHKRHSSGII